MRSTMVMPIPLPGAGQQGSASPPLAYADETERQKMLGSLPVIASFCRRLGIAATIDDQVPIREVATLTAGQAAQAMICNRLTSPAPLVHVEDWARAWAVPEILGIAPASLNDDKLGRTLDAIAPHLAQITSAVAVRAITSFGIDISQLHWDMTSFSLHGAYGKTDEDYPEPRYGHPKDRRPDLLQIQAGIAASGDGGIPVYHRAYNGGAAEISQVTGAMTALKKIAGTRTFLLIGDSKLISYDNVAAITGQECTFLAPASKTYVKAAELAACDLAQATEVSHTAQRDERKSTERRGRWHVLEDCRPFQIRNPKRKSDPPITLRRIFAHSSARASAAAASRAKKLARAGDDIDRLARGLGGRFYPGEEAVTGRLHQIAVARKVGPYLRYTVTTSPAARAPPGQGSDRRPVPAAAPARPRTRPGGHWRPAAAGPAGPPSPGGTTRTPSTPRPPPTAGTHCSPTSTPASPPPRCCCATRARKPSNAATATSRARSRSRRCSCTATGASPP